jgi:hypothetical protein
VVVSHGGTQIESDLSGGKAGGVQLCSSLASVCGEIVHYCGVDNNP